MNTTRPLDEICDAAALYAVGHLSPEETGRFEQRLRSGCPLCIAELECCQRTVEDMLLSAPLVQPDPGLEARLLARVGAFPEHAAKPAAQREPEAKIVRAGAGTWQPMTPGVSVRFLHEDKTMLVRMEPGARIEAHRHAFDEQCLVLEGAVEDTEGNKAEAGHFIMMSKGSKHPPIFTESGATLLIAYT